MPRAGPEVVPAGASERKHDMAKTDPALIPGAATGELARGSLRLVDAIAISVSVIAPGMAMLLNVTGVAAVSGGAPPPAFPLCRPARPAPRFLAVRSPPPAGAGRGRPHPHTP